MPGASNAADGFGKELSLEDAALLKEIKRIIKDGKVCTRLYAGVLTGIDPVQDQ
jgi:hypothetical protein